MEDKRKIISEGDVVKLTKQPNTITSLKRDFKTLGVEKGSIIIVHSSLSKIGWTVGGPVSVIKALTQVLTFPNHLNGKTLQYLKVGGV
jgi:aminoglycoside 3-N-acetyltransferase